MFLIKEYIMTTKSPPLQQYPSFIVKFVNMLNKYMGSGIFKYDKNNKALQIFNFDEFQKMLSEYFQGSTLR